MKTNDVSAAKTDATDSSKIKRPEPDIMSLIGFLPPDADLELAREERLSADFIKMDGRIDSPEES